jgi:hypothetical protein
MAKADPIHDRLLAIVLKLPGAYEDRPWGSVHCKVDGKIFVGWGRRDDGEMSIGIRVDRALQPMLVTNDRRFTIAKYSGQYGGVDMRLGSKPDWREVEKLIVESYRLVAPKRRIKELAAKAGGATKPSVTIAVKPPPQRHTGGKRKRAARAAGRS